MTTLYAQERFTICTGPACVGITHPGGWLDPSKFQQVG